MGKGNELSGAILCFNNSHFIWAHSLVIAGWFLVKKFKGEKFSDLIRTNRSTVIIFVVGLLFPLLTFIIVRTK
ncbi:MAG: hypothetical protein AAB263_07720, partial [Planctomycetota bacterium]